MILRGELVALREICADDAPAVFEMRSDPEGIRMTGATRVPSLEEVEQWCASVGSRPDRIDLAITHETDELLGEVVLQDIDLVDAHARLRTSMRPAHRGRGLGTEAIDLVLAHAFGELGLHRVWLSVLSINPRARMLYENHGFTEEGRLRECHRDGEFWCDSIVMALLEDDYRAAR